MKILYVKQFPPQKIHFGAEMRSRRFVRFLKAMGDVDLFSVCQPYEVTDYDYIRNNFRRFYNFQYHFTKIGAWERWTNMLPWPLMDQYSDRVFDQLRQVIDENDYDLIFIFKLQPVYYIFRLDEKYWNRVIIDFDDLLSDMSLRSQAGYVKKRMNFLMYRFNELKALKRFKRGFVCSQTAVDKFPAGFRERIGIVPNVFERNGQSVSPEPGNKNHLLFVGSLDYQPNLEGLKWFLDYIWPEGKTKFPSWKLRIVGKTHKTLEHVFNLVGGERPDVHVEINVPRVDEHYDWAFVSVVPLLNGSGTRVKILESFALQRQVLSTPVGMEGLNFIPDDEIKVFQGPRDFIASYEHLCDTSVYRDMMIKAQARMAAEYSEANFESNMQRNWERIVNCPQTQRSSQISVS